MSEVNVSNTLAILINTPARFNIGTITKFSYRVVCYNLELEEVSDERDSVEVIDENGRDVSEYPWWLRPGKYSVKVTTFANCLSLSETKVPREVTAISAPQEAISNFQARDYDKLIADIALAQPGALQHSFNPLEAVPISTILSPQYCPKAVGAINEIIGGLPPSGMSAAISPQQEVPVAALRSPQESPAISAAIEDLLLPVSDFNGITSPQDTLGVVDALQPPEVLVPISFTKSPQIPVIIDASLATIPPPILNNPITNPSDAPLVSTTLPPSGSPGVSTLTSPQVAPTNIGVQASPFWFFFSDSGLSVDEYDPNDYKPQSISAITAPQVSISGLNAVVETVEDDNCVVEAFNSTFDGEPIEFMGFYGPANTRNFQSMPSGNKDWSIFYDETREFSSSYYTVQMMDAGNNSSATSGVIEIQYYASEDSNAITANIADWNFDTGLITPRGGWKLSQETREYQGYNRKFLTVSHCTPTTVQPSTPSTITVYHGEGGTLNSPLRSQTNVPTNSSEWTDIYGTTYGDGNYYRVHIPFPNIENTAQFTVTLTNETTSNNPGLFDRVIANSAGVNWSYTIADGSNQVAALRGNTVIRINWLDSNGSALVNEAVLNLNLID